MAPFDFNGLSIAQKTRLLLIATAAAALLVSGGLLGTHEVRTYRQQLVSRVETLALITAENAMAATEFQDGGAARRLLSSLRSDQDVREATIFSIDDLELATYSRAAKPAPAIDLKHFVAAHRELFGADGVLNATQARSAFSADHLDVTAPIRHDNEVVGYLLIEASLDRLVDTVTNFLWIAAAVTLCALLVGYLATIPLQRSIEMPLLKFIEAMRSVTAHQDYRTRAMKTNNDEIGALVDVFNEMLQQIETRDARLLENRDFLERQVADRTAHLEQALTCAQQASKAKSEFLARMSHEIRTPMNGVLGMAELLQSTSLDARQRRLLSTVCRSAETLLQIINDILDFSKVEAGRLELDLTEMNLRDAVEEAAEMLAERAQTKHLELVCAFAPGVPTWVKGDPLRLRQVLVNLIGNAIKFTDSGEIVVRALLGDDGHCVRFEVQDTGPGIAREQQTHIFDAFTQADTFTTRQHGGTGLGLTICRQLVHLMNGKIGVRSTLGSGSSFWFEVRLPLVNVPVNRRMPRVSLEGTHMLVADDNATNREILAQSLRGWGIGVSTAVDGIDALEMCIGTSQDGRPFDLVILDHKMPRLDGLECARQLRAHVATSQIRIVLLSSIEMALSHSEVEKIRIEECLTKPIRQARLNAALARALGVDVSMSTQPLTRLAPMAPGDMPLAGKCVLLVEDNEVNREVALGMLAELGCDAHTAANGGQALEKFSHYRYDAVLMDCQMPLVDGFAATREMRAFEARENRTRAPIIALTANAMDGDRERCINCGMDDFLSKPFSIAQLRTMLVRWAGSGVLPRATESVIQAATPITTSALPSPHDSPLDLAAIDAIQALRSPDLLDRMIKLYDEHAPRLLQEGQAALDANDAPRMAVAAHELKSSSANLGARLLTRVCKDCEAAARRADLTAARTLWQSAIEEHRKFRAAIAKLDIARVA